MSKAKRDRGLDMLAEFVRKHGQQQDVAKLLGIHKSHLSHILSGKRVGSVALYKRIEELTGIPMRLLPHEREVA